jgi:plastocyanin
MRGRMLWIAVVGAALVLTLVGTACSKGDPGGDATPASGGLTLGVKDFQFDPSTLEVKSGTTTITVTNTGSMEHSFTLDDGSVSQDIDPGESQTVTVNLTADAGFHCKYHPTQMTGTLNVA